MAALEVAMPLMIISNKISEFCNAPLTVVEFLFG